MDLTHLNRSYTRSILRAKGTQGRGPVHRPQASTYTAAVLPALTEFWRLSDRLCGKRLVPFLRQVPVQTATGWTETRAVRNKSQEQVVAALRDIRSTLPYDAPCTPHERVLASPRITEEAKEALRAQEQPLDPVALHERILADERRLWDLVLARDHTRPHVIPRKAGDWQLHPVSSRF
jgi:hypothetical protein